MTPTKIKSAPFALIALIAISCSAFLLAFQKNAQLALITIIVPISLTGYLYPRHVFFSLLILFNLCGFYLSGRYPATINISATDWIVFDILCIFFSEFFIYLKTSHSNELEKIAKNNTAYFSILKYLKAGVMVSENNKLFFINDQLCKIIGCPKDEITESIFLDLACPDEKHKLPAPTSREHDAMLNKTITFWIINKKGEKRFIENSYNYSQISPQTAFEIIFTSDLTDQKQKEERLEHNQKSLSEILSSLPGLVYRRKNDAAYSLEYVSEGAKTLTGHTPEALVNNHVVSYRDLIHPEDRETIQSAFQKQVSENKDFQAVYRIITNNAETKWVWEQARMVKSQNDKNGALLEGLIIDITDQVIARQALIESEQKYKTLANSITDLFIAVDENLLVTYWNTASKKLTGIDAHQAMGKAIHKIFPSFQSASLDIILQETIKYQKPKRLIQKLKSDGEPFLEINVYPSNQGAAIFGRDITEQIEAENQLKYLSTHDALTRIYNRAYFETELERLQNSRLFPISIVMADLDGLKYVNDNQGHAAGDELLRQTANLLRESFRTEDVVARIGGDEFGILISNTGVDAVHNAIKRVRSRIQQYNKSHPDLKIKLSIGVATSRIGESLEDTSKRADRKMYEDKSTHKGDTRELTPY